jgi:hypothetical protein
MTCRRPRPAIRLILSEPRQSQPDQSRTAPIAAYRLGGPSSDVASTRGCTIPLLTLIVENTPLLDYKADLSHSTNYMIGRHTQLKMRECCSSPGDEVIEARSNELPYPFSQVNASPFKCSLRPQVCQMNLGGALALVHLFTNPLLKETEGGADAAHRWSRRWQREQQEQRRLFFATDTIVGNK